MPIAGTGTQSLLLVVEPLPKPGMSLETVRSALNSSKPNSTRVPSNPIRPAGFR